MKNVTLFDNVKELKQVTSNINAFRNNLGGYCGAAELDHAIHAAKAELAKYTNEAVCPRASEELLLEYNTAVNLLAHFIDMATNRLSQYAEENKAFIIGEFGTVPEFQAKGFEHNGMVIVASDADMANMIKTQTPSIRGLTMLRSTREGQQFAFIPSGYIGCSTSENREFYVMTRKVQ